MGRETHFCPARRPIAQRIRLAGPQPGLAFDPQLRRRQGLGELAFHLSQGPIAAHHPSVVVTAARSGLPRLGQEPELPLAVAASGQSDQQLMRTGRGFERPAPGIGGGRSADVDARVLGQQPDAAIAGGQSGDQAIPLEILSEVQLATQVDHIRGGGLAGERQIEALTVLQIVPPLPGERLAAGACEARRQIHLLVAVQLLRRFAVGGQRAQHVPRSHGRGDIVQRQRILLHFPVQNRFPGGDQRLVPIGLPDQPRLGRRLADRLQVRDFLGRRRGDLMPLAQDFDLDVGGPAAHRRLLGRFSRPNPVTTPDPHFDPIDFLGCQRSAGRIDETAVVASRVGADHLGTGRQVRGVVKSGPHAGLRGVVEKPHFVILVRAAIAVERVQAHFLDRLGFTQVPGQDRRRAADRHASDAARLTRLAVRQEFGLDTLRRRIHEQLDAAARQQIAGTLGPNLRFAGRKTVVGVGKGLRLHDRLGCRSAGGAQAEGTHQDRQYKRDSQGSHDSFSLRVQVVGGP